MNNESSKRGPKIDFEITEEILNQIREMSGLLTQEQMYNYFGIGKTTWYEKKAAYPEMAAAIKSGKSRKIHHVASKLMDAINKGEVSAIIFFLKTQAGWSDKKKVEISVNKKLTEIPVSLGIDPIAAARKYKEIMSGG